MWRRRRRLKKRRGPARSRAKPKTGWSIRQLAALGGTTVRTVRLYLERGIVPRPTFMGSATRYQRRQLLFVVAARRLRVSEKLELDAIRARVNGFTAAELEAFATADLGPGALADALAIKVAPGIPQPLIGGRAIQPAVTANPQDRWTRLQLAIGLELHVREDISARDRQLAWRIWEIAVKGVDPEAAPPPPTPAHPPTQPSPEPPKSPP